MKLRHQLLLMSLLLLSLPWAGCQYVREMERVMQDGNERELIASAQAIALMLADEQELLPGADAPASSQSIYFHQLPVRPDVDGYADDWRNWSQALQPFQAATPDAQSRVRMRTGAFGGNLYLFIDVDDPSPVWNRPTVDAARGDRLQIDTVQGQLLLAPISPGTVRGEWQQPNQTTDYGVQGIWRDSATGYQIELRLSPAVLAGYLGIRYLDAGQGGSAELAIGLPNDRPAAYVAASSALSERLDLFANNDLRLGVGGRDGWLLGSAGDIARQSSGQKVARSGLSAWIYRLVLGADKKAALDNWRYAGRFQTLDVLSALNGQTRTAVFAREDRRVLRAVVPISRGGEVLGVVVAEKSSAALIAATDTAFGRLVFWGFVVTLLVAVGLLAYASLLSWRIRRLSRAAEEAMADPASGALADNFPVSKMADEIGDLGRSYRALLSRLDEYTHYLKTLTSKLSHELRTPLAIIRSSLDNLEQEQLHDQARLYSGRANDGAARLSAILNAMSTASHLEQSIQASELEVFDLNALVESAGEGYRGAYPEMNLSLRSPGEPVMVKGAPDLIMQLLDKLVDNARDFCPKDGSIELALEKTEQGARLSVANDGPLLPEHMQAQLFDSLVSVREKRDPNTAHLGLGLYIVRLIAEHHNARVFAENRADGAGVMVGVELAI